MKNIQKIGGFASLAFGLAFTVLLILLITIASQGYVPGSGNNPAKALEFAGSSPLPYMIYLLYMLSALLIVLIVLALADRMQEHAPVRMQLAIIAASAAGILFLTYAMLGYVGEPLLIGVYQQDASLGASAYLAMRVVSNALNSGAIFAAGWAILLAGWASASRRIIGVRVPDPDIQSAHSITLYRLEYLAGSISIALAISIYTTTYTSEGGLAKIIVLFIQ
jgi:hypothetical protein